MLEHAKLPRHTSGNSSDADVKPPLSKQTARRRAYAKRSCLKCREKKARCELPDLTVPSSKDPLVSDKACHRCKVLGLDCVVWDGDRKRKPKILTTSSALVAVSPNASTASSFKKSPGSLDQLAAVAAQVSGQHSGNHAATGSSQSSTNGSVKHNSAASMLASLQFFNPTPETSHDSQEADSRAGVLENGRIIKKARLGQLDGQPKYQHTSDPNRKTPRDDHFKAYDVPINYVTRTGDDEPRTSTGQPPGRTWSSLWRPLSVLIDYAAQQPSFVNYLLTRVDTRLPANVEARDLISKQTCLMLKPHMKPYILWHPHLPSLDALYDEHKKKPTTSSTLLLCSMCLVACRHVMPLTADLPKKLSAHVDHLGLQILLSAPRDLYTVQALELLLAHEPSLVGTKIAGANQASRGNALIGEGLLAAALSIAKDMKLDKSVDTVHAILNTPDAAGPLTATEMAPKMARLSQAMAEASLWFSLRIWQGHFVFINASVRPLELASLVERAKCMIAVDDYGKRLKVNDPQMFMSVEQQYPGMDEESVLRSAGRTGLVYRLLTMYHIQDGISDFHRILVAAPKPQPPTAPSHLAYADPDTMNALDATCMRVLGAKAAWQHEKRLDFAPFATVRPAILLEDWAAFEFSSLWCLLSCLAICAFMTGELNCGFSALDLIEGLRVNKELRDRASELGWRRSWENETMVSSFLLFDRGVGYSNPNIAGRQRKQGRGSAERSIEPILFEATGAPLFLTSALVADGCKTFLEQIACTLMGFFFVPEFASQHLVFMSQAATRLEECDRNNYDPQSSSGDRQNLAKDHRRANAETSEDDDDEDAHGPEGKSISQIAVVYIDEMVEALQKWKLGASLRRHPMYALSGPKRGLGQDKVSNKAARDLCLVTDERNSNGTQPHRADTAQTHHEVRHQGSRTSSEYVTGQDAPLHNASGLESAYQQHHTLSLPQRLDYQVRNHQSMGQRAGPEAQYGTTSLASSNPMPETMSSMWTTARPAGSSIAGSGISNLGGAALNNAGAGGGMHEIPLFDGLLESVFGNGDWSNNAAWFESTTTGNMNGLGSACSGLSSQQHLPMNGAAPGNPGLTHSQSGQYEHAYLPSQQRSTSKHHRPSGAYYSHQPTRRKNML